MDVVTAIERSGGLASRATLIAATSRAEVDQALRSHVVFRAGHGRYALPDADEAASVAFAMNGHLALSSAAASGWAFRSSAKASSVSGA